MSGPQKLVLVDGSSYLYRAFHALPQFSSSRGEPTGAVLGVINMLLKLIKDESPELIAIVFDAPGKTFRDELFEEYKADRQPMPDDLRKQVAPILEIVAAMGLPLLRIEGVEADDVIGTLATRAASEKCRVLISTGDKDMTQLVNEYITCVNTMTDTLLDRAGVKAKFDVYPEQIVGLPCPDRRQHRQHSGSAQGRAQDRGQVAQRVLNSRQPDRQCGEDRRQSWREPARAPDDARALAQARNHRLRFEARRHACGARTKSRRTKSDCARCTPASS